MSVETLYNIAETRRSIYMLNDQLPVSKDEVVKLVEHAVLHTPSSFNSQSSRLVVLFGEDHQKLWQITEDLLRAMVNDDEKFKSTADKMAMFKAGAGTILYFEDQSVVKGYKNNSHFMRIISQYGLNTPVPCTNMRFGTPWPRSTSVQIYSTTMV